MRCGDMHSLFISGSFHDCNKIYPKKCSEKCSLVMCPNIWGGEGTSGKGFNCTASVSGLLAVVCLLQGFFLTLHQGCVLTLLNY